MVSGGGLAKKSVEKFCSDTTSHLYEAMLVIHCKDLNTV